MGQKAVENGSANKKKVFQLLPKGLPIGKNSYIKKSEFIPRNLPTVFLNPGKEDGGRGNPLFCRHFLPGHEGIFCQARRIGGSGSGDLFFFIFFLVKPGAVIFFFT